MGVLEQQMEQRRRGSLHLLPVHLEYGIWEEKTWGHTWDLGGENMWTCMGFGRRYHGDMHGIWHAFARENASTEKEYCRCRMDLFGVYGAAAILSAIEHANRLKQALRSRQAESTAYPDSAERVRSTLRSLACMHACMHLVFTAVLRACITHVCCSMHAVAAACMQLLEHAPVCPDEEAVSRLCKFPESFHSESETAFMANTKSHS
eukprot:6200871-Pleurochrysis_carterae.AAC.3